MRIAVSACLLGEPCRYDGRSVPCVAAETLAEQFELVPVCPEVMGGMPTPRVPSEVQMAAGRPDVVLSAEGQDVTGYFVRGAEEALRVARESGCVAALLKQKSPSCGSALIYDGSFSGTLVSGRGLAARRFAEAGLPVFDESQVDALWEAFSGIAREK
ncbi:MAG: DUF523 domain-containing protein [Coriobacteriia bacterium]|nr:DUF523 domain-containing protein [Coriobacteriia bacterium]